MTFYRHSPKIRKPQSPPIPIFVQNKSNKKHPFSRGTIDYKNVVLLRQFLTIQGKIVPRRVKRLTAKQQRHIAKAIKNARIAGFLPFVNKSEPPRPWNQKKAFRTTKQRLARKPINRPNQQKVLGPR